MRLVVLSQHALCWTTDMQACAWYLTTLKQLYLFALSSESWRSRWTRRTWFTLLASFWSIWHFEARRSTSNLGWLAQAAIALQRAGNGWGRHWVGGWNRDGSHDKLDRNDDSPFHPWDQEFQDQAFPAHPVIRWKDIKDTTVLRWNTGKSVHGICVRRYVQHVNTLV